MKEGVADGGNRERESNGDVEGKCHLRLRYLQGNQKSDLALLHWFAGYD